MNNLREEEKWGLNYKANSLHMFVFIEYTLFTHFLKPNFIKNCTSCKLFSIKEKSLEPLKH